MARDDRPAPFLEISPYVRPPAAPCPALAADLRTEVAIVGGGYTGLSTALALQAQGVEAVVLERDFCGYGASGRNAGHLTPTICKDLPTARMLFGAETAGRLARFADHCVETAEATIRDLGIDCDYNASGNIMAVVHPAQEKRLRQAAETARSIGARMHYLEAGEMRARGLPAAFLSGALEEAGGTLHTGKFVSGLRAAALARGVRIFEGTAVQAIEPGRPALVRTAAGTVSAGRVVLAANAYAGEIAPPGDRQAPLYITLFETAPLSAEQRAALGGWPGREGIYTAHESMESYRLTAQGTIIGGSKDVQYFYDCAPHNHGGPEDARPASVIAAFRARFPELRDLPIAHCWAGWCGFTLNFLPLVGRHPAHDNLFHAIAYNGHGIAQATAMGPLLTDLILGRPNPWTEVICRKPAFMPPKWLRYPAVKAVLGVVNGIDRRMDGRVESGR
ncbi:NAD(P)/FAD-dependent oxidoreductase [Zavarzinia sp.]|uniref:NAD(P)/FAD-dependent oxidoreductase n=1 Tax=Zavarzinia sp. TaxID=2027920 RepID=UPI0035666CF6